MKPLKVKVILSPLKKSAPLFDDGLLTTLAVSALSEYATSWVAGSRNLDVERRFPDLSDEFYEVRADVAYARRFAVEPKPALYVKG